PAMSAAGFPAPKKPLLQRLFGPYDDPWWKDLCWEDEFDRGDPLAPAIVTARDAAWAATVQAGETRLPNAPAGIAEKREQAKILPDLFRYSCRRRYFFRRVTACDPAWLARNDGTAAKLARAIYDGRAFDRLPVLADALEEAGCTNAEILG